MIKTRKVLSVLLCTAATVYTLWYMHFGVPYKNSGALSKIGLEHRILFTIWGVLTYTALTMGIKLAFEKTEHKRLYIPFSVISGTGMLLTLANEFDYDKKLQYYLHCTGSLLFSAVTGICIFLLFFLLRKKDKIYLIFCVTAGVILIVDLICLLIFKETGLIETLPIFAGYILLTVTNLRRDRVEIRR